MIKIEHHQTNEQTNTYRQTSKQINQINQVETVTTQHRPIAIQQIQIQIFYLSAFQVSSPFIILNQTHLSNDKKSLVV